MSENQRRLLAATPLQFADWYDHSATVRNESSLIKARYDFDIIWFAQRDIQPRQPKRLRSASNAKDAFLGRMGIPNNFSQPDGSDIISRGGKLMPFKRHSTSAGPPPSNRGAY